MVEESSNDGRENQSSDHLNGGPREDSLSVSQTLIERTKSAHTLFLVKFCITHSQEKKSGYRWKEKKDVYDSGCHKLLKIVLWFESLFDYLSESQTRDHWQIEVRTEKQGNENVK